MKRSYFFIIGVSGVILLFLACYVLPLVIHWDPLVNSLRDRFLPPEGFSEALQGHILGTDSLGRDVFVRLLIGGQYSFRLAFICVALQVTIGSIMGMLSGYLGGWIDVVIMRACDMVMSIPGLVLAMAIMAIFGVSTTNLVFCLTFTGWVNICKVTRNDVRIVKQQEFIMASSALGAGLPHIIFRQIFPNVTTNIIILGSQRIGMTIL
ncbi:MAG: ABC transporter permease, partial [Peptococcaceae bacterium]|nr:ABC transporter permease [Peptococcaceae bacterium]